MGLYSWKSPGDEDLIDWERAESVTRERSDKWIQVICLSNSGDMELDGGFDVIEVPRIDLIDEDSWYRPDEEQFLEYEREYLTAKLPDRVILAWI